MENYSYRKLNAYIGAKALVKQTYAFLKQFPREEQYALCDQLRRSIISVSSNIAEGMGRVSVKEQLHFLEISYGSLMEAQCQMEIALELGYITKEQFEAIDNKMTEVAGQLAGLRKRRLSPDYQIPESPISDIQSPIS